MPRFSRNAPWLISALLLASPAMADSLSDALEATYRNNPTIQARRAQQMATDEEVAQALSGFRPNASAAYARGRQRTSLSGAPWTYENSENRNIRVTQPLFRGGGTFSSYNSAKQRARAGENQLSAVEQQVLLDAVTAYMDVAAAIGVLELSRGNENTLAQQLKAAQERFEVGEVTRTDVAQSESRLSIARTQVVAAEGRLISAIAAFERVVGYKPEGLLSMPATLPPLPASLEEALSDARAQNPELIAAVHAAKSSEYDVWTNKSSILPRVDLVGTMSRQDGAGAFGNTTFDQDTLGLEVNIPLYQSGAEYSRVREAKNIARQRKYAVQDTRQLIDQRTNSAWERLETAIGTIALRQQQIDAAQLALDGVRQEQQYGARTVLDILDAEQELYVARTNLVQADRDRVVAAYALLLTLGKLTPDYLQLAVKSYDAQEHYDDIKWQPFGF